MSIYNWTEVSKDPNSPVVMQRLADHLEERLAGRDYDYMSFLKEFVSGKSVLDVGVAEHDISYINSNTWKHRYICDWASSALGVDILDDEVKLLKDKGYNVVCVDATSDVDLGSRHERVTICDVIEHVDNPVDLLKFAGRHLEDGGRVLVVTPNPYWYKYIIGRALGRAVIPNVEHISWITPTMAHEIGRRSGLALERYWLAIPKGRKLVTRMMRWAVEKVFGYSELFTWQFYYVFRKADDNCSDRRKV